MTNPDQLDPVEVSYRSASGAALIADLLVPAVTSDRRPPVVLLAHGGGWQLGSRSDYAGWARSLASAGFASLSIDYTLAAPGRSAWPAAAEDVDAAFEFIADHGAEHAIDPGRIAAMGTSAGAHLLAAVILSRERTCRAAVLVNGVFDLPSQHAYSAARGPRNAAETFLGGGPDRLERQYLAASPYRLVPTAGRVTDTQWTIVYGELDPIVPPESQAIAFSGALSEVGADVQLINVPEATHHWNTSTPVDEGPNLQIRDAVLARLSSALAR
jgi:acetyl esterase/lipase